MMFLGNFAKIPLFYAIFCKLFDKIVWIFKNYCTFASSDSNNAHTYGSDKFNNLIFIKMKTFVLFQHSSDNKPVVESTSTKVTYRSNMYLMDKWAQEYDILYGYDKVLEEEFYVVNINGEQFHAESLGDLFHDMKEYHNINIVAPFLY